MSATVQIVIEADDGAAAAALDDMNTKAARLTPTLQQVGAASDTAMASLNARLQASGLSAEEAASALKNMGYAVQQTGTAGAQAVTQMNAGFSQTRVITDLLTGNISRAEQALVRLGAATSALAPLMAVAFAPAAFIAFGELAVHAGDSIAKVVGWVYQWADADEKLNAINATLAGGLAQVADDQSRKLQQLADEYNLVGLSGGARISEQIQQTTQAMHLQALAIDDLNKKYDALMTKSKETVAVAIPGAEGATVDVPSQQAIQAKQQAKDVSDQLAQEHEQYNILGADLANLQKQQSAATAGLHDWTEELLVDNKQFDDFIKKSAEAYKQFQSFVGNTQQLSSLSGETRPGGVPANFLGMPIPDQETFNFLDTAGAKTTQTFQQLDAQMMANIETDQKVAKNAQEQATKYAEAWTRARDTMANQLNSFFDELTTGNIGAAFLRQFEKMVSQMVATWLMGIQGMQQSVTRSGGLFGSLGDFLGLGGGGAPAGGALSGTAFSGALGGGAFSFSPSSAGFTGPEADMLGLPMSSGVGGALGGVLPAGASIAMGGAGGTVGGSGAFGGLLNGIGSLLPIGALAGGSALLGKGGILGMLGSGALGYGAGAIGGPMLQSFAASGFLSGMFGAGTATMLDTIGSFLGPIGAGIGLISGLIGLFTGKGKLKEEQTALLQQMELQLNNLQNAFNVHQLDYNSAISQAEQIRQSYTQQQESLQQGGSVGRVDPWVNATEQYINNLEQQRQNEVTSAASYGPAQFSEGGFVHPSLARMVPGFAPAMHFATGGAVPAIVHAGEYVLNAGAVTRMGVNRLDEINSGGGAFHIANLNISAIEPRSFEDYLNGEGGRALGRALRRGLAEGRY